MNRLINRLKTVIYLATLMLTACGEVSAPAPVYDDNTAFVLAGQEIPAGEQDYYLFDFTAEEAVKTNAQEIQTALKENPIGSPYVCVIGPNAEHNFAVLKMLMAQYKPARHPGVSFIYLGPASRKNEVRELLKPLDMDIRYVVYP